MPQALCVLRSHVAARDQGTIKRNNSPCRSREDRILERYTPPSTFHFHRSNPVELDARHNRAPNTSAHDFPLLPMYYYRSFDLDRSTLTRLSPDKRWKSVGDVDVMRSECFFRQYFNAIRGLCLTIDIRYRIDSMHNLRLFFFSFFFSNRRIRRRSSINF